MSPSYWKRLKERRLERSRKGVAARASLRAERMAGLPMREWKLCRRVTDVAINRMQRIIELWTMADEEGQLHHEIRENGQRTTFRSWAGAIRSLAKLG